MSTFSPNLNIEEVARNADVGTWDTPTNSNWTLMDSVCGNISTISLNNANVVLSAAQFQSKTLIFNSTLTGSVTITFATSFTKSYEIQNACTGSSAFTITLETTAAGGQVICPPPGETIDIINDGTNLRYKNMGRIGGYWDYAGSSVPNWVTGCTVNPYLPCTGASFSSATYPVLATILGQTTTPDRRGTVPANLDQGAGRLSGILFAVAGSQNATLGTSNLPPYTPSGTIANTYPAGNGLLFNVGGNNVAGGPNIAAQGAGFSVNSSFTGNAQGGVSQAFSIEQPTTIVGITMIRSA